LQSDNIANIANKTRLVMLDQGAGGKRPSESGNNKHFQRYSCPGPDF